MNKALILQINCYHKNCLAKTSSLSSKINGDSNISGETDLDLSEVDDLSLSSIMRELRKQNDDAAIQFLKLYKKCFDFLSCNVGEGIEDVCLKTALDLFKQFYNIKLEKTAVDNAQLVGQYLANIIKFTVSRISTERRPKSIETLKGKLYRLNESELANKKLPASSSMGQAITFVKHVLFNHDPQYIRQVINYIVAYL